MDQMKHYETSSRGEQMYSMKQISMEQVELYERTETKHYETYKHYGIKKHCEASCITMEHFELYETNFHGIG